ncbi:tetratricopeptide repeat protein [Citreimonas salinaria]|uniref:Tetratricopeptide repeat-containing protein n=1 Tax=Citreimonas salinaria TaxID=321339 RepID=A0A1H3MJF4_9RHOB|nr:tetratricopeptide repeat protein [Citreimonas salinaria]SDY76249.1 Tetratricopeptide repeat-containing protein [Citreimonas salinaria]
MRLNAPGIIAALLFLAACTAGGLSRDGVFAPGIDPAAQAEDGLVVGHRLMQAGEYQLALDAFTRAAGQKGLTAEVLVALGSANLALGRLNQAEDLLRRATREDGEWPEAWNNLGVVLIERGQTAEAAAVFRKAFALDNGQSTAIRDNLRLALAKLEDPGYADGAQQQYRLVREGSGSYRIRRAP